MAASSRLGVLMKLDKNQRKPRVFKASDLCPYYNRRVDAAYNSGRFHIFQPFLSYREIYSGSIICTQETVMLEILSLSFLHSK